MRIPGIIPYLKYLLKKGSIHKSRKLNVAMLHFGRCGSTVIGDMINQRIDFRWDGEIFEDFRTGKLPELKSTNNPTTVLRMKMATFRTPYYGFESKAYPEEHLRPSLLNQSINEHIDFLKSLGFSRFILLERENLIEKIVSNEISLKTGLWHLSNSDRATKTYKAKLDPQKIHFGDRFLHILEVLQKLEYYSKETKNALRHTDHLLLSYETDISADPKIAIDKINNFLGLPPQKTNVRLKRTNPKPVSQKIENIKEIKEVLKGTKYSSMLN